MMSTVAESGTNPACICMDFSGKQVRNEKHLYAFYNVLPQGRKVLKTYHILYYCNLTSFLLHVFTCQAPFPSSVGNAQIYTDA